MDVVEAHDVLQGKHDRQERPSKPHEQQILADPPQDIYQNLITVLNAVRSVELSLGVVVKSVDLLINNSFLKSCVVRSGQSWVSNLNLTNSVNVCLHRSCP